MIDACVFVMIKQNTTRNERKRARGKQSWQERQHVKRFINTHKKEKTLSSLSTTAVLMGKKNDRRIDKNYREKKKYRLSTFDSHHGHNSGSFFPFEVSNNNEMQMECISNRCIDKQKKHVYMYAI